MKTFKIILAAAVFLVCLGIVSFLFWHQELKYVLPTPVPADYKVVYVDEKIDIGDTTSGVLAKPVLYHFFSTDCPCSKFNLDHFNRLKRDYADEFDFFVVVPEGSDLTEAKKYFRGETKLIEDRNKEYAIKCGVYSTPQAVIIDTDRSLYYRGNYNRARYCIDPASNFAQMALDSLVQGAPIPEFGPLASLAYGCGFDEKKDNSLFQLTSWNDK